MHREGGRIAAFPQSNLLPLETVVFIYHFERSEKSNNFGRPVVICFTSLYKLYTYDTKNNFYFLKKNESYEHDVEIFFFIKSIFCFFLHIFVSVITSALIKLHLRLNYGLHLVVFFEILKY